MSNEGEDALAQLLLDDKIRGKSYQEISTKHGIPVDEVIKIIRGMYAQAVITDPNEFRALLQLRIEKITDLLWGGLENGSFKNAEAILKGIESLKELHDLNQKTITHEVKLITDSDALLVVSTMKAAFEIMREKVSSMPLGVKAQRELAAWPEWTAEATTTAVEKVIYAEPVED